MAKNTSFAAYVFLTFTRQVEVVCLLKSSFNYHRKLEYPSIKIFFRLWSFADSIEVEANTTPSLPTHAVSPRMLLEIRQMASSYLWEKVVRESRPTLKWSCIIWRDAHTASFLGMKLQRYVTIIWYILGTGVLNITSFYLKAIMTCSTCEINQFMFYCRSVKYSICSVTPKRWYATIRLVVSKFTNYFTPKNKNCSEVSWNRIPTFCNINIILVITDIIHEQILVITDIIHGPLKTTYVKG